MRPKERKNGNLESKGITLIALVITIIVLLILAGVTVSTLTGDNGLLAKAGDAKQKNEESTIIEKIQVEVLGSYNKSGEIDLTQLRKNLQNFSGITTEDNQPINDNTEIKLPMLVKINGNEFVIKSNGTVKIKGIGITEYDIVKHPETYYGKYVTNYTIEKEQRNKFRRTTK